MKHFPITGISIRVHRSVCAAGAGLMLMASLLTTAWADFGAMTERLGYAGLVSVYDSLADAREERDPRWVDIVVPQRDGTVFAADAVAELGPNGYAVLTNDYADFAGVPAGTYNPSDALAGFVQLYDDDASQWLARVGYWHAARRQFTLRFAGRNAAHAGPYGMLDYARFWNAGELPAGLEGTMGIYHDFALDLTARFDRPAVRRDGRWTNDGNAADFSGTFRGIFENTSVSSPESNGFYVFELRFNATSWSALQVFLHDNFELADDYLSRTWWWRI